jgi:hypothetical protein
VNNPTPHTGIKYKLLFRPDADNEDELKACRNVFGRDVVTQRSDIDDKSVVYGRYSVLPYYRELDNDLLSLTESYLVNSPREHRWIADFEYYTHLEPYTFKTYFQPHELPEGKYVVKGRTNSRKFKWKTHMFCETRRQAIELGHELMADPLIAQQGVVYREYEELEFLELGIHDQPFVNEHRFFMLGDKIIDHGFYWSQSDTQGDLDPEAFTLVKEVAAIASKYVVFYVLDIAKTAKGKWKLVEINDAQMSGLSCIDPASFYAKLKEHLDARYGV